MENMVWPFFIEVPLKKVISYFFFLKTKASPDSSLSVLAF
jgi:hypothetical protein